MSEGDWRDPFADDDAARERERRRAEREARRRDRRRQLADRVREESGARTTRPAGPAAPSGSGSSDAPPRGGGSEAPSRRPEFADPIEARRLPGRARPASGEEQPPPPAPERDAGAEASAPPAAVAATGVAGETGEHGELGEPAAPAEPRGARSALARRRGGVGTGEIRRRRLLAVGLLAAAIGLVGYGAVSVADRLGGGEPAPPPPPEAATISVTIPEGYDRRQIAAIAADAGLRGNYERESRRFPGFNPGRYGAEDPPSLEGFLFPATYELHENDRVRELIERQLEAFREQIGQVNMRAAEQRGRSTYDVLNIAAMIEREVQIPEERRLVSAVIHNRLDAGNPLGIDATIRYEDENYEEPLTESRLAEPTPYNTRVNAGLPPTPIGNPGLAAIRAAANPADTNDFYYVVEPYTCGEHFFTDSEAEFQQKVAEYQAALEEEGGAPTPEDC